MADRKLLRIIDELGYDEEDIYPIAERLLELELAEDEEGIAELYKEMIANDGLFMLFSERMEQVDDVLTNYFMSVS